MTRQIDRFKGDEIPLFTVHLCLDGPIRWKAIEKRPEVEGMPFVNFGYDNLDDLQSQYNDARLGIPPQRAGGATCTCTHVDPTQAPPGKHVTLLWQYSTWDIREEVPPYYVKKGEGGPKGWDVIKKEYGDYLVEEWIKFAPNLEKDILARYYHSPLDISRTEISMLKGSMMFGTLNDQMLIARPFRSNIPPFRTPLKGLYICNPVGPSIAGCSGAPGYGCANAIAEDLKLKKWWKPLVVGKK